MIQLIKINIEGFGSIRSLSYVWSNPGINIIQGKNGSGKTTLISALPWVIFGETLKGSIEPWKKWEDFKGTKIDLTVKVGLEDVMIVRCKDYTGKIDGISGGNKIFLYINGKYQKNLRDKKDVQNKINSIFGVSFKLFKSSILFGQKLTRLLQETGTKQKEVFDEAFNTSFINTARKAAVEETQHIDNTYTEQVHAQEILQQKQNNAQALYNAKREEQSRYDKDKYEAKEAFLRKIHRLAIEIHDLEQKDNKGLLDERDRLTQRLKFVLKKVEKKERLSNIEFRLSFEVGPLQAQEKQLKEDIKKVLTYSKSSKKCMLCQQPLTPEHIKVHGKRIQEQLTKNRQFLKENQEKIKKLTPRLYRVLSSIIILGKYSIEKSKIELRLKDLGIEISKYDPSELKSKKLLLETYKKEYDETAAKPKPKFGLKKLRFQITKYNNLLEMQSVELSKTAKSLENHKWVIDYALSNKGLKAYIFNSLLYSINQELAKFKPLLGYTVEFKIDLESGNKNFEAVIYKSKQQIQYNDLSGGEQQLVDICLALSINSAVPISNNFNVLILDEVFESLDPSNTELVADLLVEKARKKNIHLITHNFNFSSPSINNVLRLKSKNGVTTAVQ